MVPLTSIAHLDGNLVHANEVLCFVGEGYFVKKTALQAVQVAERRKRVMQAELAKVDQFLAQVAFGASDSDPATETHQQKQEDGQQMSRKAEGTQGEVRQVDEDVFEIIEPYTGPPIERHYSDSDEEEAPRSLRRPTDESQAAVPKKTVQFQAQPIVGRIVESADQLSSTTTTTTSSSSSTTAATAGSETGASERPKSLFAQRMQKKS
jgi:hypothetical protein